jgi:hypothetical protein
MTISARRRWSICRQESRLYCRILIYQNQLKLGDANEDSKSCGLKKRIRDSINLFNKHSYKMTNTISLKYYCAELVNPGP